MQTDNQTLLDNVERTLHLAVDPNLTDEQRKAFLSQGTELRGAFGDPDGGTLRGRHAKSSGSKRQDQGSQ
jgi:hypothetical protein